MDGKYFCKLKNKKKLCDVPFFTGHWATNILSQILTINENIAGPYV
jgi:hypothetical protein